MGGHARRSVLVKRGRGIRAGRCGDFETISAGTKFRARQRCDDGRRAYTISAAASPLLSESGLEVTRSGTTSGATAPRVGRRSVLVRVTVHGPSVRPIAAENHDGGFSARVRRPSRDMSSRLPTAAWKILPREALVVRSSSRGSRPPGSKKGGKRPSRASWNFPAVVDFLTRDSF